LRIERGLWRGPAGRHVLVAAAVGIAVGAASAAFVPWQAADLLGWCVAALCYLSTVWHAIGGLDAPSTEDVARREDPSLAVADAVVVTAAVACIAGAGLSLVKAAQAGGDVKAYLIALAILSVVSSWASVHTVYTLRYARLYYGSARGGIDFNDDGEAPTYHDFAYVAFTIGMTFQVSDTDLTSKSVRSTALHHALLSYLFGAVIIGLTINIVASLLR
jgi:uncharacterized membrane protein